MTATGPTNADLADRAFVDANVLVYSVSRAPQKQPRARTLLTRVPQVVLSVQVISEFTNATLRLGLLTLDEIEAIAQAWLQAFEVVPVDAETIRTTYAIKRRYGYSWWDSVMLAAALLSNREVVYTEDLQNGQLIDGRLRIVNPFR